MASSSAKHLFCYVHMEGQFGNDLEGDTYVGGQVRTISIKEGTTFNEFKTLVASIVGKGSEEIMMKFTVRFDKHTFVDMCNDDGIEHFILFNGESGHVYVGEKAKNECTQLEMDNVMEEQDVFDELLGSGNVCSVSPPALDNENEVLPLVSCADEMIPTASPEMNCGKWKDLIVGEGQTFSNARVLRKKLYKYSIAHRFSYKFIKNNKQKIIVKCKVDGCPWYMGAYCMGERQDAEFLSIRRFTSQHMHNAQEDLVVSHHGKSSLTSSLMINALTSNIDKNAKEISKDLYRDYGVRLNYRQAYRGREEALRQIHGSADDSYKIIPWICERLIETDPRTVAKWEASESKKFERVFIAYGCSIEGFLQGWRAILYIDGCHLSGPYRGTMLTANAHDADNELFPFAYAIVSGETNEEWTWFLHNVKEITGSLEITIMSDRNNAIIAAVQTVFSCTRHAYCYRHVKENYSAAFIKIVRGMGRASRVRKEDALKLLDGIAYARLEGDFKVAMGQLQAFCPELAQWVETHGDMHRWAMSKFSFKRWDNITTNLAESFNAWILQERRHNVSVLILEHQEKLAQKVLRSKLSMVNWTNGVGPNIEAKLMQQVRCATNMHALYWGNDVVQVETWGPHGVIKLTVDLQTRKCTCLGWQMSGLPCVHACAAIKLIHGSVYTFVDDCYKLPAQAKVYASTMRPIATHDCPCPNDPTVSELMKERFLEPPSTRRPPGRPKRKRIESQLQNRKTYYCGRCHDAGHTVKTCKNPNPT